MIRGAVEPIGHEPPYRRLDPTHPGRKKVITMTEVVEQGGRGPDRAIYEYHPYLGIFVLKDGV